MIVIGQGRVGAALCALDPQGVVGVNRTQGWESLNQAPGRPVLVATRNDSLAEVVGKVPKARHRDLVFVQNGMLRPWIAAQGLGEVTRGILFFAVQAKGDAPVPGGVSPFCGPQAAAVVSWMKAHGLEAAEVSPEQFAAVELEKLAWNCVFGVMGQALQQGVGELLEEHGDDYRALSHELLTIGAAQLGIDLDVTARSESMAQYARSISQYRASVKEWPWRNGWFVQLQREQGSFAGSHHARWLERAGVDPSRIGAL